MASTPRAAEPPRSAPLVERVQTAFESHLQELRQQGRAEVRMELHPPQLGHLRLHVALHDNEVSVRMVVHNEAARQTLEQQLEPLRVRFAEMGVQLGQLDVRREDQGGQQAGGWGSESPAPSSQPGRGEGIRASSRYARTTAGRALVDVLT